MSIFASKRKQPELTQALRADIVAKSYKLHCPRDHNLVNSLEPATVVGIIGNVHSSKSHYLAGLVYELIYEQQLSCIDADVAYIGDTGKTMDERIHAIYQDGDILQTTERGQVGGPFSYRLTRHAQTSMQSKAILTFFDVAGEDCVGLASSADFVRYLFNATGIVLLIDPDGLPSPGRPLSARGNASLTSRAIIDNLADALEAVTGRHAHEQDHIICIAIAKADSADLASPVWPPEFWMTKSEGRIRRSELRASLREYSEQCKRALSLLGGQSLINAAETRFRPGQVFYSAVSATNQAPLDQRWVGAQPVGCTIPLAQILCFSSIE